MQASALHLDRTILVFLRAKRGAKKKAVVNHDDPEPMDPEYRPALDTYVPASKQHRARKSSE
jgi:hypothetical protein